MVKISRADAKAQNERYYFTGRPCGRGHLAWRYVSSGGCSECIAADTGRPAPIERRKAPHDETLIEVAVRAHDDDWPVIRDTAAELARAAFPNLQVPATSRPRDRAAGTALYTVRVPLEHEQLMRETAAAMLGARRVDVQGRRAEILRTVVAMVDAGTP